MDNALRAKPEDVREQYERQLQELQQAYGEAKQGHMGFTAQRIFQIRGWQVRKRAIGIRPRIQVLASVTKLPNERWSTDLCRVWSGRDGWASLALVIDCQTRELLVGHLLRTSRATMADSALE